MYKMAVLLLAFLLFSGIVNAQWVLNNGNYLQSVGTNKIGIGVLPGVYPGNVNIAAQSTEPHIWLYGGPSVSANKLSSKFNINSSASASLGLITTNSIGGGGLGILEGPYIVSPVVWMDNSTTGNNAFTVGRMNYSASGVSDFENNFMALLQVRENGNVGIGTTNPGNFKLAVEGKIGAREVNVTTTSPWPDYVFEKDYALSTLESVKTYIDQNKHLPEVPSAKEMEANGINLSEMNMLLLKKVEELTLYVIELKKGQESVNEDNQRLRKELEKLKKEYNH